MQSTKSNQAISSVYNAAPSKALSPEVKEQQHLDRSFVIACCLGAVTVVFGVTALAYQFAPEFNRLKNSNSRIEMPKFSTFQG